MFGCDVFGPVTQQSKPAAAIAAASIPTTITTATYFNNANTTDPVESSADQHPGKTSIVNIIRHLDSQIAREEIPGKVREELISDKQRHEGLLDGMHS